MINLRDITRIEIIDDTGRAFSRWDVEGVTLSGQDEGRTLKIFLEHGGDSECSTVTVLQAALWQLGPEGEGREAARGMIERHLEQILGGDNE